MSNADRSQYAAAVTTLSENELQDVITVAEPPACLLGEWAVHLHVTDGFQAAHGRPYLGSRDIDLGVHIDPQWSEPELEAAPVATTLERIEHDLGYHRGRFGFYQQFHRDTGDRLTDEESRNHPAHNVFRVDIDSSQIRRHSIHSTLPSDFAPQPSHCLPQYSKTMRANPSTSTCRGQHQTQP